MSNTLVVIPTYNEIENIADMIDTVMALEGNFDILIVDDNSPDGTGKVVKEKMEEYKGRVHILERPGKQGLGRAYIAGFTWALGHDYEIIIEMDADFSHNPKDLVRLQNTCREENSDIVIGSRYVKGGRLENWPFDRKFLSYGASVYVRLITGMPVKDPTAGFVCYHRRVLEALPLNEIKFVGYAFQIEMKYRSYRKGFKLREIPITFTDRVKGNSKMNKSIISEAISGVIQLKWGKLVD